MFKEFNVEFQDVEMIGGADNLLENTKVTKVVMSGDNKMSSLDSTFKNCSELDNIQGELNLNDVSDIDNILEDTELVKRINLKNVNNENISADNSFPNVEEISIGGDSYNKKAIQNVIASKDWTFDNITYSGTVGDNIVTKEVNVIDDNKLTIKDTLEQKAKGIEIVGQTYENLIEGSGEVTLLDKLTLESIDGSPNEFTPHAEQPVYVKVIEGETYQNLVNGKGEYKLADTTDERTISESEIANGIENLPSAVEITSLWGNTYQNPNNLNEIVSLGDLYVDEEGNAILDEDGNEQYKLEIESVNNINLIDSSGWTYAGTASDYIQIIKLEPNTKYTYYGNQSNNTSMWHSLMYCDAEGNVTTTIFSSYSPTSNVYKFTTGNDNNIYIRAGWSASPDAINKNHLPMLVKGSTVLPYIEGTGNNQSNKTTILMPQPLRKINNDLYDKLYWDYEKNKYLIQRKIGKYFIDSNTNIRYYAVGQMSVYNINNCLPNAEIIGEGRIYKAISPNFKKNYKAGGNWVDVPSIFGDAYNGVKDVSYSTPNMNLNSVSEFRNYCIKNNIYVLYPIQTEIIETKILEKVALKTYSPKTYVSTNTEVKPSEMTITNKETILSPMSLQANTDYTLQLDSIGKNDKLITVNLGGTETTIQPVNGTSTHHKVVVRTPATLTNKTLELSGEGVTVNDVMLFEGGSNVIKQEVGYVDGIESIGELQEDGTYKIDILSMKPLAKINDFDFSNKSTQSILLPQPLNKIGGIKDKFYWDEYKGHYCIEQNVSKELEVMASPNIIDLPHLNKKYSLDTYMPTTYLQCVDTAIQPSKLLLESDIVRYKPSALETNTDYTVQFECKEKSNKKIKLNLGGSEKEVDAIVGLNHVSITTPNELSKDRLFLGGVGNKVDNVMVVKGEMNQYPEYFEGIANAGELQDDGSYRVGIKSNEGFNVSIISKNPLVKGDKLYWNKSNKRYEIDRDGEIEIPIVNGDVIDLPRLYQRKDTTLVVETGNIKPSSIKVEYLDID